MKNKTLEVNGITIRIQQTNESDYISLSDIAKKFGKPNQVIRNWLRKGSTLGYLAAWEKLYNSNFNQEGFRDLSEQLLLQGGGFSISAKKWIEHTNAIGITVKAGRYGSGIFAHSTIAIGFAYWLSPEFQIYLTHSFIELMQREYDRQNLEWHVSKITNSIDEVRNLLDTIPGQNSENNRLGKE